MATLRGTQEEDVRGKHREDTSGVTPGSVAADQLSPSFGGDPLWLKMAPTNNNREYVTLYLSLSESRRERERDTISL